MASSSSSSCLSSSASEIMKKIPEVKLSNCEKWMPVIGMGTCAYPLTDMETTKVAMVEAIRAGYRHFDTAFAYGSEKALGEAITEALRMGLIESRHQLFITTKLWCTFASPQQVLPACKLSLQNLGLDYMDMYLIHQPLRLSEMVKSMLVPSEIIHPIDVKGVWEAMEECKSLGLTKAIGVSNFSIKMLQQLLSNSNIPPSLNQVEMNTSWQQKKLREFCEAKGIHITAYSPLGANNTKWGDDRILDSDVLMEIAKARGKTTAQVALRWVYEQGTSLVTKSYNKERMRDNLNIFDDWSLSKEDLDKIAVIPQRKGVRLSDIFGRHDLVLELESDS